ncbi:MAG: zinc-dependent metalloprotease family protein [Thermoanaerobaculia bacterium]|nr:zinc-dependent metalloprotease family protein [Thermoanaerobaculia bacterium]
MCRCRPSTLSATLFVSVLLIALSPAAHAAYRAPDLVRVVPGLAQASPAGVVNQLVAVDLSVLTGEAAEFRLELPDGPIVHARRDGFERRGDRNVTWRGRLLADSTNRVVLTVKNGYVAGSIRGPLGLYEIRPLDEGLHVFERLDPAAFPSCAGGIVPDRLPTALQEPLLEVESTDAADDIHLMSLYTAEARSAAGGVSQIETLIQSAVDSANTAFIDSNMVARYNLVHTAESTRNDSGDMGADLSWLQSDAGVAALRDEHAADMVSLIVSAGQYCGIAYVQRSPGSSFESYAFQVTLDSCAVGNLTFAHEHGHNMGFEHDPANGTDPSNASYPWSFGHYVDGSYRTVMSYSNQCGSGCTRVAHHSNPDIVYNGQPTGVAEERDNARTGDSTAPIVADFRLASTAVCGNGILESGEECDGTDLGGALCGDVGCTSGTPSCTTSCTLDYSSCTGCPQCDNDGVCESGENCEGCADCPGGVSSGAVCGNGLCETANGEDCVTCPSDCNGFQKGKPSGRWCCGDGGTNPIGCEAERCDSNGWACTTTFTESTQYCCGDATCTETVESACSCPECGPPPAGEFLCNDGLDDDCDGLVDCDDPDCDGDSVCGPPPGCFPLGASCSQDSECCSLKCRGKKGSQTCR